MTGLSIAAAAVYLPGHRLAGTGPKRPARTVAAYDEDSTTMAVEAARMVGTAAAGSLLFATTTPPYLVKSNASAIHSALRLDPSVPAFDIGTANRSIVAPLALAASGAVVVAADVFVGTPGAPDEHDGADAAAALVLAPAGSGGAEIDRVVSTTDEVLDRWRQPSDALTVASEERFVVHHYDGLLEQALSAPGVETVDRIVVSCASPRVARSASRRLSALGALDTSLPIGHSGAADPLVRLVDALQRATQGERILLVVLADGCDLVYVTAGAGVGSVVTSASLADQVEAAREVEYLDLLAWRGLLQRVGSRRPDPAVVSAAVSARNARWKYRLEASRCGACGSVEAPPQRVCVRCGAVDQGTPEPLSERRGRISTYSIDRLAYTPSPPMVAAVVDFEGGGRLEVEMTDTRPEDLSVGLPVQMTFRRKHSSGGIHNYTWKARPGGVR